MSNNFSWNCKKLQLRGEKIFIHFGVPGHVEINRNLQTAFDSSPTAIFIHDRDGTIIDLIKIL